MTHHWDEFSKLLAEQSVPRRETLRLVGAALAGAVLTPLGLGTASAGASDPCKAFCNQCPKTRRTACLAACRNCSSDPSNLCGNCGSGYACTDFANDVYNCGACGNDCWPGVNEVGVCFDGECLYACEEGAIRCDGVCTRLDSDPANCGACGNVCPESAPACLSGVCSACPGAMTNCGGYCAWLATDPFNCGACGNVCPSGQCADGECYSGVPIDDGGV
jgi:hypothetical protein